MTMNMQYHGAYSQRQRYSNKSVSDTNSDLTELQRASATQKLFRVTVRSADPVMGSADIVMVSVPLYNNTPDNLVKSAVNRTADTGTGFVTNTKLSLKAKANDGYRFVKWNDGVKTAVREVVVKGNADYVAHFERVPQENPQGIDPDPVIHETTDTPDSPSGGGVGGSGVLQPEEPSATNVKQPETGIVPLLKKWWWVIAVIALMAYDLKGGK